MPQILHHNNNITNCCCDVISKSKFKSLFLDNVELINGSIFCNTAIRYYQRMRNGCFSFSKARLKKQNWRAQMESLCTYLCKEGFPCTHELRRLLLFSFPCVHKVRILTSAEWILYDFVFMKSDGLLYVFIVCSSQFRTHCFFRVCRYCRPTS